MKFLKLVFIILIVFLKTGNLLSDNNLFSVNNIFLEKKDNYSTKKLANQAIKKAFNQLTNRIILNEDLSKVVNLKFSNVRELVAYYNISKNSEGESNKINFSVTFDKEKIHDLFYKKGILYSDIADKEFFILPILLKENEVFIFSNNYFYKNWNSFVSDELLEFILPLENIEIIYDINKSKNNLLDIELSSLFKEYPNKNTGIVLIEESTDKEENIFLKAKIQNKIISKSLRLKKDNLDKTKYNQKKISLVKNEIEDLVKSQNLIDISTPSFLNVKLNLDENNNLAQLKTRINNIDLIENVFVQEFNKNHMNLKIKYLGKLEKIINQMKKENISLKLIKNQWFIEII